MAILANKAPSERASEVDQISHAVVRVHLDVDTFRDSMALLASSHDTRQFSSEAASLRQTLRQHVDRAEQLLRATPDLEQGAPISSALESLRATLLSQLDTAVGLANAGEWNAVKLRLAIQIPALIEFSSSLVERVDQKGLQQRRKAIEDAQKARQRIYIIVPIAAVLTLLAAAALGWYATQTVTGPLSKLTASADALARGDFQHKVHLRGNSELAVLANAFNYAAQQLQKVYEDLRRSERELRGVVNTVPAHVWSASPDGTVDFVNGRLLEFVGLSSDDILGWNWESVLHPDDRTKFVADWRAAVKDGQAMESEVRVRRADGRYCWFFIRNVPLRDDAGNISKWYGSGIDITDLKRAAEEREKLRQLQVELAHINRVTTMGELAASLAHEIKQPISAAAIRAKTGLRWLQRQPPDIEKAREILSTIIQDATRAVTIVDRNRSLYKREKSKPETVNLNEVIRETITLLHEKASQNSIQICLQLDARLPMISADRVQVQQVLMNLILNGIEAMKETRGELTITSETKEDNQLLISVRDSGVGLPVEDPEKIFEPFFTTKQEGTGMGLSISRRIIESHGGRLWAAASPGGGAIFHFTLRQTAPHLQIDS